MIGAFNFWNEVCVAEVSTGHTFQNPGSSLAGILTDTSQAPCSQLNASGEPDSAEAGQSHVAVPALQPLEGARVPLPSSSHTSSQKLDFSPGVTFVTQAEPSAAPTPMFGAATTFYTPIGDEQEAAASAEPATVFGTPQGADAVATGFRQLPEGATREVEAVQLPAQAALDVSPLTGLPAGATAAAPAAPALVAEPLPAVDISPAVSSEQRVSPAPAVQGAALKTEAVCEEASGASCTSVAAVVGNAEAQSRLPKPPKRFEAPPAGLPSAALRLLLQSSGTLSKHGVSHAWLAC